MKPPEPTPPEFSPVCLFNCMQVCWHFWLKSSPPCGQVCAWPPRSLRTCWERALVCLGGLCPPAGAVWMRVSNTQLDALTLADSLLAGSEETRPGSPDEDCVNTSRAGTPQGWVNWPPLPGTLIWACHNLGPKIQTMCLCQGEGAITMKTRLSTAATDGELRGLGDRAWWVKAGDGSAAGLGVKSCLYHLPAVQLRTGFLISWSFSFLIIKWK